MVTRRGIVAGLLAAPLYRETVLAQDTGQAASQGQALAPPAAPDEDIAISTVPIEEGHADFAGVWELTEGDVLQLVAKAPDLPRGFAEDFGRTRLRTHDDIEAYFSRRTKAHFIDWFNQTCAGKGYWAGRGIVAPEAKENFRRFWTQYMVLREFTLMEFMTYMSVFVNECGGNLQSVTESYGNRDHPGIAYLYNRAILGVPGRTWTKKSYNTKPLNRLAGDLFVDPTFKRKHGELPLADRLVDTDDLRWKGVIYPRPEFPVSGRPAVSGIILEADFFKFRGRGLIQTTWRANYVKLVPYIQANPDASEVMAKYARLWKGMDPDMVCTVSTNADWNALFADPKRIVLCEAVRRHARDGRYLGLSTSTATLNGVGIGSIAFMGDSIGGKEYGQRLKARVRQVCTTLGQ